MVLLLLLLLALMLPLWVAAVECVGSPGDSSQRAWVLSRNYVSSSERIGPIGTPIGPRRTSMGILRASIRYRMAFIRDLMQPMGIIRPCRTSMGLHKTSYRSFKAPIDIPKESTTILRAQIGPRKDIHRIPWDIHRAL
eukprot:6505525-Pyramimonas_sp.AAC.1